MLDLLFVFSFIVSLPANVQNHKDTAQIDAAEAQARQPRNTLPLLKCRLEGQLNQAAPLFLKYIELKNHRRSNGNETEKGQEGCP